MKSNKGMSLIELLLFVVMISVISSVVWPGLKNYQCRNDPEFNSNNAKYCGELAEMDAARSGQ